MNNGEKFVDFYNFCKQCKNEKTNPAQDPCDECLGSPINYYSHKPINFEEKERN